MMTNEDEEETAEIEVTCYICMEETQTPMLYQCCQKISCKNCYITMHRQYKQKTCPYCRHNPVSAIKTPLNGGIRKKKKKQQSQSEFLISHRSIMVVIKDILRQDNVSMRITKSAAYLIRQAMEQDIIERMRKAQQLVEMRNGYTVMHVI